MIPNPSTPFFSSGFVWVGGGDGRLYQMIAGGIGSTSVQVAPAGTALGSPGVDVGTSLFHVGAENGVLYTVEVPLP
jgi:hypothetical protein